jgi:tetratricopeptide (TPR) repeat protein
VQTKETPAESAPGLSAADLEKKNKLKGKIDKFMEKVEGKKTAAADAFKLGQYGDAVKHYKAAADMLESAIEDFPLWKQELVCVEATIFNNMAACCKKELNSKLEIEYTTKVIERCSYITDSNVILKAYLRRGLAYEQCEKYLQAKEDMLSVK